MIKLDYNKILWLCKKTRNKTVCKMQCVALSGVLMFCCFTHFVQYLKLLIIFVQFKKIITFQLDKFINANCKVFPIIEVIDNNNKFVNKITCCRSYKKNGFSQTLPEFVNCYWLIEKN